MPYKSKTDRSAAERFRLAKRKLRFIQEAGGRCMDCGFSAVPEVLQFHHRNGDDKVYDLGVNQGEARVRTEVAKCDLVCPTCHAIRHLVEEEWRGQRMRFRRFTPTKGNRSQSSYNMAQRKRYKERVQGKTGPGGPGGPAGPTTPGSP